MMGVQSRSRRRDWTSRRRQQCRELGPGKAEWASCSSAHPSLPVENFVTSEIRKPTTEEMNDPRQMSIGNEWWQKHLTPADVAAMEANKAGAVVQDETARLPECAETMRVIPSALLRSALFGIVRRGERKYVNDETLTTWKGASIQYSGQRLDQYDLDVWLQVLHIVREQKFDVPRANFTARGFLEAMDRKYSGAAAKVLFQSLKRMVACAVTVSLNGRDYTGSLIEEIYREGEKYVVRLNPKLYRLFEAGYTRLAWDTRLALPTDLSRWLHGYVLSHQATMASPHRITVEKLQALTGSSTARLRKFRETLRQAMAALEKANVVWRWRITEGDALEFVRPSSIV